MIVSQPQLLQIALDPGDVVYTPDWVARDMVEYFKPSGRILEPCAGDGAILRYLPGAEWCEIEQGLDFFAWHEKVDWCIGNPPYSMVGKWIRHSMEVTTDFVYLMPCAKSFYSFGLIETVAKWGGIRHIRFYGGGARLRFPIGFAIGATHYQKGYAGPMYTSIYDGVKS